MHIKTFTLSIFAAIVISVGVTAGLFFLWMNGARNQPTNLINQVTNGNVIILNQFNAVANLQGFVVQDSRTNTQSLLYVDSQGRYLISGTIIDAQGHNITAQNFQQYIASQSASIAFNYVGTTSWIQQGSNKAPHQMYVVFDPNCTYCHRLYEALQPYIQNGTLAVRWIPVAFLKPASTGRAYAILSSPNPQETMAQNEANFDESTENGGIAPLNNPPAAVKQQLQNNMSFLTETQINATPAVFYKTSDGIAKLSMGIADPDKLKQLINTIGQCF